MKHNILYSFRRCPYAIRARWALLNTNQLVELREVDLKNKPMELVELSKKATVPVLKTKSNKVIDESIDIMIWSIKKSNMNELLFSVIANIRLIFLIRLIKYVEQHHAAYHPTQDTMICHVDLFSFSLDKQS